MSVGEPDSDWSVKILGFEWNSLDSAPDWLGHCRWLHGPSEHCYWRAANLKKLIFCIDNHNIPVFCPLPLQVRYNISSCISQTNWISLPRNYTNPAQQRQMYALHSPVSFDSYDAFQLSMVLLSLHLSWLGSSHTQACTTCASLILLFVFVRVRGTIVVPVIEPLTEIPSIDCASFICLRYTLSSHSPRIVSFANTHTTHLSKLVLFFYHIVSDLVFWRLHYTSIRGMSFLLHH